MNWQKLGFMVLFYGALVLLFSWLCGKAPMDPNDANTREDEK